MTGRTYAVWSHHVPASELVEGGFCVVPDGPVVPAVPIKTFDSLDEAEVWRLARVEEWKGRVL